jgi:hypothetical protein
MRVGTRDVKANTKVFDSFSAARSGLNHPATNTYKNAIANSFIIVFLISTKRTEENKAKTKSLSNKLSSTNDS